MSTFMLDSETFPEVAGTILSDGRPDPDELEIDMSTFEDVADPAAQTVTDGPKLPPPPRFAGQSGARWVRRVPLLRLGS